MQLARPKPTPAQLSADRPWTLAVLPEQCRMEVRTSVDESHPMEVRTEQVRLGTARVAGGNQSGAG